MNDPRTSEERVLKTGDYAMTNYSGKDQRVRLVERIETPHSQSGYSFRVQALSRPALDGHYDAAWFWPVENGDE